jgi:hypothetical protein
MFQDAIQVGVQLADFRIGKSQVGQSGYVPHLVFRQFHASAFFLDAL